MDEKDHTASCIIDYSPSLSSHSEFLDLVSHVGRALHKALLDQLVPLGTFEAAVRLNE